jgi:hypothetical protein
MKVNLATATAAISKSSDKSWLREFRDRMVAAGESDVVDVLNHRLAGLNEIAFRVAVGKPIQGQSLVERVRESVRIYEEFLARKHGGRRIRAARTNAMIKRWGEKEALRRTVTNLNMSTGLELLAKYGRLDCAYEQIILDFAHEFDQRLITKAKANLSRLPTTS